MKLFKHLACLVVFTALTAIALSSSLQAQDVTLSVNDSFEDPIGGFAPNNWFPFSQFSIGSGSFAGTSTTDALFGLTHAVASINGVSNSFAGFAQQIDNVIVGEDYTFSLNARTGAANLSGINRGFRIEWVDQNGQFVGGQFANNVGLSLTDTYASFSQTSTAPVGATSLRAVFFIDSFGVGNSGSIFVDGTSVTGPDPFAVPEPTNIALLVGACAGMVTRRRRS